MELIYNLDENNYKVVQYKNTDTMKTFKLKYPINTTDSINDILNKISISCKESEISSDHLFVFVQKQMIKESHIDALEEKILSNKFSKLLLFTNSLIRAGVPFERIANLYFFFFNFSKVC